MAPHRAPIDKFDDAKPITIGNNVWVGFGVVIMPGVTIGDGAVIGCRSVVYDDVEPYSVAAGNPAKHIKFLEIDS
jgi:acetyltransferase-like isoleucine patch superfamily enzyme